MLLKSNGGILYLEKKEKVIHNNFQNNQGFQSKAFTPIYTHCEKVVDLKNVFCWSYLPLFSLKNDNKIIKA